ncbi:hypothetical protein QFC19_000435 [Naganishia cerealis]|uniref:Uncharacterized protein n=1 Tax=Naganishia cerealis TaxID=610337 RepID=A0ACC2WNH3_9TREE|nr:hypothetical protein QFC19_000435 [Naganishia cerealis]
MQRSSEDVPSDVRPRLNHSVSARSDVGLLNDAASETVTTSGARSSYIDTPSISRVNSAEQVNPVDVHLANVAIPASTSRPTLIPSVSVTNFEDVAEPYQSTEKLGGVYEGADDQSNEKLGGIYGAAGSRPSSMFSGFKRRSKAPSRAQSVRSAAGKSFRSDKTGMTGRTNGTTMTARKPFQSTRLKGEIYKPWLEHKDPALRWARWITLACIAIGFGLAGYICYDGVRAVPSVGKLCQVLDDDFSNGFNTDTWTREVRLDGYGNGEFEWTTPDEENSFVQDGVLYLVPTLTSDKIGEEAVSNGYTLNLTVDGTCTSTNVTQCAAVSNSSLLSVINPVRSARLHTKKSVNIKYGKVEVTARMPTGDWLWPAIWMLPKDNVYGAWPRSGEIDLAESRGNNASYGYRGNNYVSSALHWGPTVNMDRYYWTQGWRNMRRSTWADSFHTFGMEWNENFLWTYVDSRVNQIISLRFNKESFWSRGKFPSTFTNGSDIVKLTNIWSKSEDNVAPFDQEFYLILNLAVGGTNGWFPDSIGGKPWIDDSLSAMSDFWLAKDKWYNTWPEDKTKRGLAVKHVKMVSSLRCFLLNGMYANTLLFTVAKVLERRRLEQL